MIVRDSIWSFEGRTLLNLRVIFIALAVSSQAIDNQGLIFLASLDF